jgi:hypothetical protein
MAAARRSLPQSDTKSAKMCFSLYSLARVCPRTFSAVFRHFFNSVAVGNFVEMFSLVVNGAKFPYASESFALSTPNFECRTAQSEGKSCFQLSHGDNSEISCSLVSVIADFIKLFSRQEVT